MNNTEKSLAIIPRTLVEVESLAEKFAKSTLIPDALRNKPADVFVSILAGAELGLPPMASLRGVHVIQGKSVVAADTMVALVLGSGAAEFFRPKGEATIKSATYETKRKGDTETHVCTWTLEDAKTAELLGKDNWKKNPRAMLKARSKAMLARDIYPDILAGCYDPDELSEAIGPSLDANAIDAEVVERQPLPSTSTPEDLATALIADIETAPTADALDSLLPRFAGLAKGTDPRRRAAEAMDKRRKFLSQPAESTQETAA